MELGGRGGGRGGVEVETPGVCTTSVRGKGYKVEMGKDTGESIFSVNGLHCLR